MIGVTKTKQSFNEAPVCGGDGALSLSSNQKCQNFGEVFEIVNLFDFFSLSVVEDKEGVVSKKFCNANGFSKNSEISEEAFHKICTSVLPPRCQENSYNASHNSQSKIPKVIPNPCNTMDNINFDFDYVESSLNYQGNYHNYVSRTLKSIIPLRLLNYASILEENKIILPKSELNSKTLILDLDETLIHADFDGNFESHDHIITFSYEGQEVEVPIILRPGLFQFLENISELFEVFVFTASKREYADAVLNFLDPYNRIFKRRFYRENCINIKNKVFVKDLRVFVNRKPENIIIVDNSLYSFSNQLSNGVLINSFYDDKEDRELINLFNYLQKYISNAADSRAVNEKVFNFNLIFEEYADSHFHQNDIRISDN